MFTVIDPQGRTISLIESQYTLHILDEHPDMLDIDEIEQTIRSPNYIAQDALDDKRLIYYRTYRRRPQHWLIKVVVEENEIITAYRVNRLKQGETILWRP